MDDAGEDSASPMLYTCPHCGGEVEAAAGAGEVIGCPHCASEFELPATEGETATPEHERMQSQREAELDGARIQQVARSRRAAIRARSYCLIALLACVVTAIQLLITAALHLRGGWYVRGAMYFATAAALAVAGWHFLQKMGELGKEAAAHPLPDPKTPPDFTALSDGSQH